MTHSGSVFSETLQSITTAKLDELSKKRSSFEKKHEALEAAIAAEKDPLTRLLILSDGVKDCFNATTYRDKSQDEQPYGFRGRVIRGTTQIPKLETDLIILEKVLTQARFDSGTAPHVLPRWEAKLRQYLQTQSLKYRYATLYGELVTEWLSEENKDSLPETDVGMSGVFEEIPGAKKLQSRMEWEMSVFEPVEIDVAALKLYLGKVFGVNEEDKGGVRVAIKNLRLQVETFERDMASANPFTVDTLTWTIEGLSTSDLLDDDQRSVLKDILGNDIILNEIADVLNLRLSALNEWNWGEFVPVEQRRSVTGAHSVHLHEDLLQAILLQYIGRKWAVFFKEAFILFRKNKQAWKTLRTHIPVSFRKKLSNSLVTERGATVHTLNWKRRALHREGYFSYGLPNYLDQRIESAEGDEEAELDDVDDDDDKPPPPRKKQTVIMRAGRPQGRAKRHRKIAPSDRQDLEASIAEEIEVESEAESDDETLPKRPMLKKQRLLHLVSTEVAIAREIHGELSVFRSIFEQWNPLLPHSTILTVLRWFGVSQKWLDFFQKFLEAPLKFIDDPAAEPRVRRRGAPGYHELTDMFGEVLLFSLDFSINQVTDGGQLHRVSDDFWFWSPNQDKCVEAWQAVEAFTRVTGTSLNKKKTGCVRIGRHPDDSLLRDTRLPRGDIRWGFLKLSAETGRFEIDQALVDNQITELRSQLENKSRGSIFSWIRAWNISAINFFASNFGKPANCFGQSHVKSILATHQRIHQELFSQSHGSVAAYLKGVLQDRFGVSRDEIPDAFIYFPVELGGLGLLSPFVEPVQLKDQLGETLEEEFATLREEELEAYEKAQKTWESRRRQQEGDDESRGEVSFLSFEEYTRYREDLDYRFPGQLSDLFDKLLKCPEPENIEPEQVIYGALNALSGEQNLRGITTQWYNMEPYWRWITAAYGPDLVKKFDGLRIVDPSLLPIGMVSLFKDKRVKWNG
ncbi:hypothetical protein P152DRAFT_506011 [Eremomyces bilateralis CBS 781.70]|uniref:Reverse transcriptase domain-containing protein n=1 Tax=Eremomyces bilateralis CBS 781.70 TaxID=1392243 RepID=A0A6G1GAV1_9PEZI|nr:uncharacterized protein P152DRAFT_506011 [Eremomyces bilateralis CBS 781.70]KAF1815154.1 hypothetical protein P152DRAFT_506011 [Eremomyces bilateralis CBS 781.70]